MGGRREGSSRGAAEVRRGRGMQAQKDKKGRKELQKAFLEDVEKRFGLFHEVGAWYIHATQTKGHLLILT